MALLVLALVLAIAAMRTGQAARVPVSVGGAALLTAAYGPGWARSISFVAER